ncbi:ABC transporter permease, partial [Pseudomonas sp. FW305-130]
MLSPVSRRRLQRFRRNRLGWVSLWLFAGLLLLCLGAELVANDKPLLLSYKGELYVPALKRYSEPEFGGQLPFQPDYRSAYVRQLIADQGGWMLFAPIPFSADTPNYDLLVPTPS